MPVALTWPGQAPRDIAGLNELRFTMTCATMEMRARASERLYNRRLMKLGWLGVSDNGNTSNASESRMDKN